MADKKPNRLIIKEMIEAGGATKESIATELEITKASLATNFTYLRLMGFYPIADEDGVLSFTDENGWKELQDQKAAKAGSKSTSKKSPAEQYAAVNKKLERLQKAADSAIERHSKDEDSEVLTLKKQKAEIELRLAEIEKQDLEDQYDDDELTLPEPEVEENEEVEVVEDADETDEDLV